MFRRSKWKKYLNNSDQKHRVSNCERWEETSRRPNMQIIGIPGREKVIEENFLELKKKPWICRLRGFTKSAAGLVAARKGAHVCLDICH